jgi:double-stranded RNA binding protein
VTKLRPVYTIDESGGAGHRKEFLAQVVIDGRVHGTGRGTSKKAAQQKAARQALEQIEEEVLARSPICVLRTPDEEVSACRKTMDRSGQELVQFRSG